MYTKDRDPADEKVTNWRIKQWEVRQILLWYYSWPIYNVAWNLHTNSFYGICIKSTSKKYAKIVWSLWAGNKVFVKYQDQGGGD